MAAAAQSLSNVSAYLEKAGCGPGAHWAPLVVDKIALLPERTTGPVEIFSILFIWGKTWGCRTLKNGEPCPMYTDPLSYQQIATYCHCSKNAAEEAIKGLVSRGMVEVMNDEKAAEMGLPANTRTGKRRYRLKYENWSKVIMFQKTKAAEEDEQVTEGEEDETTTEAVAADTPVVVMPGKRLYRKFGETSVKVNNKSAAVAEFRHNASGITVNISDANKQVNSSTIQPHLDSFAAPSKPPNGARNGEVQRLPVLSGKEAVESEVRFYAFYDLFVKSGKPLGDKDLLAAHTAWAKYVPAEQDRMISYALGQFLDQWDKPRYTPLPSKVILNEDWKRQAAPRTLPSRMDAKRQSIVARLEHEEAIRRARAK